MSIPPEYDAASRSAASSAPGRAERPLDLGIYGRAPAAPSAGLLEAGAAALSIIWLAASGSAAFGLWGGGFASLPPIARVLGLALPVGLIWVAVLSLRTAARLRLEAASLRASIEAMRNAQIVQAQTGLLRPGAAVDRRPATVARPPPPEEQPALALGTPPEGLEPPLSAPDLVRALNFPETDHDAEGFRVLRLALADRNLSRLIRAAQDVLTLLSQEGIYMDDMAPEPAPAADWRRFARGERGAAIAALGGIRAREPLERAAARMRADPIFRDAAHHFLRQFDRSLTAFEARAEDADLDALAQTRTARAFMLLGRTAGTFD